MRTRELKNLRKIKLSDTEKKDLFNRVSASIRANDSGVNFKYPVPSPFFSFAYIFESRLVKVGSMAMLILIMTSATAFASLNTLPGDLLYGVKTNVVEKIPTILHTSPEARAKDNSNKVEKRIEEFEKLAERGRLNEENTKKLEKNITKNLGDFDENIREIKNKKLDNAGEGRARLFSTDSKEPLEAELESKLERHSEKIQKIRESDGDSTRHALESVLERARSTRND
jgi:hypothetical protein